MKNKKIIILSSIIMALFSTVAFGDATTYKFCVSNQGIYTTHFYTTDQSDCKVGQINDTCISLKEGQEKFWTKANPTALTVHVHIVSTGSRTYDCVMQPNSKIQIYGLISNPTVQVWLGACGNYVGVGDPVPPIACIKE